MNRRLLVALSFLVLTLTACALPTIPPNPNNPIYRVAVLPVYNATNDVDGPNMVRELVDKRIQQLHYSSMPLAEVDQILRDQMGVTLGAQLDMTTPQKLGEVLGVDGVVYGYLLNFDQVTTGLYNVKKVRAGFRIVDAKTGRDVWSRGHGVKSDMTSGGLLGQGLSAVSDIKDSNEGIDHLKGAIPVIETIPMISEWTKMQSQQEQSVGTAAMFSLGEKLVGKALGVHLKPESEMMVNIVFQDFPVGPGGRYSGGVAIAAEAPPMPEVAMPEFEMPEFGFPAYFELGDKDFTADMVMTSVPKKEPRDKFVVSARIAKRGTSYRGDYDMTKSMKPGAELPPAMRKMSFISLDSDKKYYMLYPEKKKYFEDKTVDDGKEPKVEKVKVGEEVVGGLRCDKYKAKVTDTDGSVQNGFMWEAKEHPGFVIKAEFEDGNYLSIMELSNLKLVSPPLSLFEVPKDYVKARMMTEIFMDDAK